MVVNEKIIFINYILFKRNEEICVKAVQKNLLKSELCWNFSTIYKDGSDNYISPVAR